MKKHNQIKKKKLIIFILTFVLLILVVILLKDDTEKEKVIASKKIIPVTRNNLEKIKENYADNIILKEGSSLYLKDKNTYKKIATVHGKIELSLDPKYIIEDEYFKIKDSNNYVKYIDTKKIDTLSPLSGEYKTYKNYIPYHESIILKNKAKLYLSDNSYYELKEGTFPILIKNDDKYGIEFNHSLVYVSKEDVEKIISSTNTSKNYTNEIAVLNYHYVVSDNNENGEKTECKQSICITDTMFDRHIKYLKENNFYTTTMRDLELYIDGKIQLPEKSVTLTFDDGWYVSRIIQILTKYQMTGTLFLIGSLASPNDYSSPYLEIHSHTWNMHKIGDCPSNIGRGGILCLDENTILEDLKKSRESLNNTTYFCYPFYDYNERAIELLKKAGFTMALAGELKDSKVRVGQDKYKIPRYVIVNTTTMSTFKKYVN